MYEPHHITVEAWARRLGIDLVEAKLDGASAQLVRLGDRVQIVFPEQVTDRGARRFSIAHEIYHYLMKHPTPTPTMMCTPKALRRGDDTAHVYEIGANAFAGECLLPEFLLRKRCEISPVSLDIAWSIAKDYDMSILSSTIRFAELSSERCAAVFSVGGVVKWAAPSSTFTREIQRGKRIDRDSVAWDFHATGKLDEREQPVPGTAWFDTSADVEIIEHSICSHEHGTVLSLLWVPEAVGARFGMPQRLPFQEPTEVHMATAKIRPRYRFCWWCGRQLRATWRATAEKARRRLVLAAVRGGDDDCQERVDAVAIEHSRTYP